MSLPTWALAQAQAAEKFGIAQSRVNDLLRGKWGAALATWREHPILAVNAKVPLCRL
jgi:hypothetical protein